MPNGFKNISIANPIIERVDKIFLKAGFNNRSSYIQDRLRDAVEKDLDKYGD